jgi:hypothetical protein
LSIHQITEQGGQRLVLVGDDQAAQVIDELVEGLGPDVGRLDTGEEIASPVSAQRDHLPFPVRSRGTPPQHRPVVAWGRRKRPEAVRRTQQPDRWFPEHRLQGGLRPRVGQSAQLSCHPTVCLPFAERDPFGGPLVVLPKLLQCDVLLAQQLLQPRSRRPMLNHPYPSPLVDRLTR